MEPRTLDRQPRLSLTSPATPVRKRAPKTIQDVRAAFESRSVLNASPRELKELLTVLAAEKIDDPAERARTREMGETMRQLLAGQCVRRPSKLAIVAVLLALAALILSLLPRYREWQAERSFAAATFGAPQLASMAAASGAPADLRTNLTIAELAKRAPSLRSGNLQAWWAGEKARQVQRLEAQAKRQALAGDHQGAARSATRADAIRSRIPALADFEKPPTR